MFGIAFIVFLSDSLNIDNVENRNQWGRNHVASTFGKKLFTIDNNIGDSEFMEDIERRKIPVKSYYEIQLKKKRMKEQEMRKKRIKQMNQMKKK